MANSKHLGCQAYEGWPGLIGGPSRRGIGFAEHCSNTSEHTACGRRLELERAIAMF